MVIDIGIRKSVEIDIGIRQSRGERESFCPQPAPLVLGPIVCSIEPHHEVR